MWGFLGIIAGGIGTQVIAWLLGKGSNDRKDLRAEIQELWLRVDKLEHDNAVYIRERNDLSNELHAVKRQLESITAERDKLAGRVAELEYEVKILRDAQNESQ